ncbi:MAG: CTP-dependent riboflavin kinase [Candidatus Thorarchaeota archaeon]|nr:CTP-dependent riboflavin kinase [Candidatus Thorarchaeota archaeon]
MMVSPEMWFTLFAIARKGALHRSKIMTTRELGEILGVSQQTASRRISDCVNSGYISRIHAANGMILRLTELGRKELKSVYDDLETAFTLHTEDLVIIEGIVTTGIGEGAYYVDIYAERFEEALGFKPYPGTLNVKVIDDESRKAVNAMRRSPPLVVTGFQFEGRTFGDVTCYRVKVNDQVDAAVVVAQRTHHTPDILEIIAPVNLREDYGLSDGSEVTLTVIPLHRA